MKKILRLTESDLVRLVKRVISEQENDILPQMIIRMLMSEVESTPQEDYDDPYDWMQDVFSPVELKLERMGVDIDDLRIQYGDILLSLWEQDDEF
jgi:hypothetical protein